MYRAKRIEQYLRRMFDAVKEEDPDAAVTYVNYPTTEYLRLGFLDFLAFNIYLEDCARFVAYLARLHHLAGDRPLLMSEIGLDSLRNGLEEQARSLESQVRTTFEAGCAGAFIFSWTDEWYRGKQDVHDWAFGLTDNARVPKPALATVRRSCAQVRLRQGFQRSVTASSRHSHEGTSCGRTAIPSPRRTLAR